MSFKKILAVVMACAMAIGAFAAHALTLDAAESAAEAVSEEAVLAADGATLGGADFENNSGVVFDGTNYHTTLVNALKAVHGTDDAVLYCKPGADLGTMTHGHVCKTLTVYGNGAYISGGEQDFEIDMPGASGTSCGGLTKDITLTVDNLTGAGVWGGRVSAYTVNLIFINCENMGKIWLTGATGANNITMTDCTFTSNKVSSCKVYSNAEGTITLTNVDFSNIDQPVSLNNKSTGTQTIVMTDCDFVSCGAATQDYTVPVSVKSSVAGGTSKLTVNNCTFTGTVTNSIGQDADIILDYGVGSTTADIFGSAAKLGIETEENVASYTTVTVEDKVSASNSDTTVKAFVAEVGGNYYTDIRDAFKAVTATNNVVNILSNVTVDYAWDSRYTGSKFMVPVTINGNGYTFKLTGVVDDKNWNTVFRFEDVATVNNLTIDVSEATGAQRIISSKLSITANTVNLIGNSTVRYGIIFGEGAGTAISNVTATVTNSDFTNMSRGVSDNANAQDVKSVTITDSEFTNASVNISASETATFTNNEMTNGYVIITTYSPVTELEVVATGNTLDETADNSILADKIVTDSSDFVLPVAEVNGTKHMSLQSAVTKAADGATINVLDDIVLTAQNAQSYFAPAYNRESYAGLIIPDDKTLTIDLNGKTVSYVDSYGDVDNVMILNLGNLTINDTVGGGKLTYKPVAGSSTYSKFYSTIFNCGTLTVNGGIIENTAEAETDVTNAVDNHSRLSHEYGNDSILVVNGGTLTGAYYYAIRQYTHYFEGVQNRVTINDGTIMGGIYMQHGDSWYYADPAKNRLNVDGYLTINGGNFVATATPDHFNTIKSRLSNPDNNAWGLEINGGTFNDASIQLLVQRGVFYTNGVSGATTPAETAGTRNTEWLAKNGGFITGGRFGNIGDENDVTTNLASFVAEGFTLVSDNAGGGAVYAKADVVEEIDVVFEQVDGDAEGYDLYNINLVGANNEVINRLNSADLTFVLDATPVTGAAIDYEIIAVEKITVTPDTTTPDEDRFMFNFNGKDAVVDTANSITIAQVKVSGYGTYTFSVDTAANDTNVAHATKALDNIVDTFVPGGAAGKGTLDLDDATTGEVTIAVPVRTLTVNVAFPNSVVDNAAAYQDMKVEITGNIDGVHQTVTYDLGGNMEADGTYVVEETRLVLNETYNVVVSGAGYRTARYTVTMTDAKVLNFWNNVKDNAVEVEEGKASSAVTKNFLAGDIVADNNINIYDLSAVVSYFATEITDEADYDKYVKYDLNRDGKIDSKDVAYVLVSWGA